ncbi:anti-sigma factor antagonist [Palleronia sediminis]|uniref:Anti-sigma factor antagonist n=1 Tax=Palleronia sediminis TaxID=2547833 RepID=A0A4R6A3Z8_9RHOB|nr:STAS domain-containing protein [Palleronia sediminis]TDL78371.1 anti-sigma factor antagonist [Palleronia sediminis]
MEMTAWTDAGRLVLRPEVSRIDAVAAVAFKDAVRDRAAGAAGAVVLDLGGVGFIDSSGLGAIVRAMKQLAPDRQLELANLQPPVAKVFALTRLDRVLTIHSRLDRVRDGPDHAA